MVRPPHPKEPRYSRRAFLRRAAATGITVPSLAAILAACDTGAPSSVTTSASGSAAEPSLFGAGGIAGAPYPLARPNAPVTWHVDPSRVIASDARPERNATVKILRWPQYLAPAVVASFEQKYRCTVEETEFTDMDRGLAKLNAGQDDFDLLVGLNLWALGRSIAANLLRPINLDLVPNLSANCWDAFQSPFYDVGSRYTVPYSVWTTGIFWRNDKITTDIAGMANPYDFFWTDAPVNRTHVLANAHDVLAMALYREKLTDVHDADEGALGEAKDAMAEVIHATNASLDHTDPIDVANGQAFLHQSWSGNVSETLVFMDPGAKATNLSYLWPVDGGVPGNVDNDLLVLLSTGKAPVLAHLFLEHILDAENAMKNLAWTGYQMPQKAMSRDVLMSAGLVPGHLANVYLEEADLDRGSRQLELSTASEALWRSAYAELTAPI
jgi:spermidine/putrescine transport system substrate-binding protein